LLPVLFGLGVYIGVTNRSYEIGYVTAELAAAARSVVLLGPLLAAMAAYRTRDIIEAVRVARPTRRLAPTILTAFWPLLFGGPLAGVLALLSTVRSVPDEARGWMVCVVVGVTLGACVCLGLLFGRMLPRVAAIPAAAAASFAWLALPGSGSNAVLRNMNSSFVGCCSAETAPATTMVAGSIAVAGVLVILAMLAMSARRWWQRGAIVGLAITVLVCGLSLTAGRLAVAVAPDEATLLAVQPRGTDVHCADAAASARVCVWPEHVHRLTETAQAVGDANAALASMGASTMSHVSERPGHGWVQLTAEVPTEQDMKLSLAQGLVIGAVPSCRYPDRSPDYDDTIAYVALLFGVDPQHLLSRGYPKEALRVAQRAAGAPAESQLAFLRRSTADIADTCNGV
jgi:hypothetical protein